MNLHKVAQEWHKDIPAEVYFSRMQETKFRSTFGFSNKKDSSFEFLPFVDILIRDP